MPNQIEAAEEWLATKVEALRTTFAKVFLGLGTLAMPLLLLWSGLSTANKILAYTLWVSVILNSFLFAVVCWHRTENRRRLSDQAKSGDSLSDLQHSLMDLMSDYYPKKYTREELEEKSGSKRFNLDAALYSLSRRPKKLIGEPKGGRWIDGHENPMGWWLSTHGLEYQQKRRSEQGGGGDADEAV